MVFVSLLHHDHVVYFDHSNHILSFEVKARHKAVSTRTVLASSDRRTVVADII